MLLDRSHRPPSEGSPEDFLRSQSLFRSIFAGVAQSDPTGLHSGVRTRVVSEKMGLPDVSEKS